jgi:type I restriction enzyme S subunit
MNKSIFDKSKWKKVRFGDIAVEYKKTLSDNEKKHQYFIGLEHIDPNNLQITKYGVISEGISFTKTFKKGDILFGRRRAYQKKAAIAPFDGICSSDILVFTPHIEKIDSTLFPFIVQNDYFFDYAMKTSAGSLSPRTKFKDLANFEFLLPPLDEQKKIADLLWSANKLMLEYHSLKYILTTLMQTKITELIWRNKHPLKPLKEISALDHEFKDGDWIENKNMSNSGIRLIQLADIGDNAFLNKSRKYISEYTFEKLNCFELLPGDLLMARMPDPIGRTCEVPNIGEKMITAVDCCIIRVDGTMHDKKYWLYLLNSIQMRRNYEKISLGTTRKRISKSSLQQFLVPTPTKHEQIRIVEELLFIEKAAISLESQISALHSIISTVTSMIFG